jgi:hypothetical protein
MPEALRRRVSICPADLTRFERFLVRPLAIRPIGDIVGASGLSSIIRPALALRGHWPQPIHASGEKMSDPLPTQADGLRLHQRLIDGHTAAPSELAKAYWQPLLEYLGRTYPRAPEECRAEAAGDALISFIKRPTAYDPARMDLFPYLRMSASRDLLNRMKREARYHKRRVGLNRVEHLPEPGSIRGGRLTRYCGRVRPKPATSRLTRLWPPCGRRRRQKNSRSWS